MARVLLSLPDEFLAEVDALAQREQRSRSELVREALRRYLHEADGAPDRARAGGPGGDALGALESIQRMRMTLNEAEGPTSEEWIRSRRERNERLRT